MLGALTRLIGESTLMCFCFIEQMVDTKFRALLDHSLMLLRKKWVYGILDDFVTKQLPNNVTWGLSLLYALEHKGDRALVSTQGEAQSPPFPNSTCLVNQLINVSQSSMYMLSM